MSAESMQSLTRSKIEVGWESLTRTRDRCARNKFSPSDILLIRKKASKQLINQRKFYIPL